MTAADRTLTREAKALSVSRGVRVPQEGMTLFELLLVLVLLVVVGSLAAPLYEGSFASIRLRRGIDQVLAAWTQARTQAIEAGQIYQFRFQAAAGNYRVDPWMGGLEPGVIEPTDILDNDATSATVATAGATADELELLRWKLAATLPEDIVFHRAESLSEDEFGQRSVTRLDLESSGEWSSPILFYPDGTTSAASLLLTNGKSLYRRATLRALTGVARASDLLTRDEVNRYESH